MLKVGWRSAAVCAFVLLLAGPVSAARVQPLESGLLDELNFARTQPVAYAQVLAEEAASTRSARSSFAYENRRDLEEALDFLQRQPPLAPLRADERLGEAALSYAQIQGRQGGFGHQSDGVSFSQRMRSRGVLASLMAEDISYGYRTPRDVARQLIVDSGIPDRGHRNNIFGPSFEVVGIGCGPHSLYGSMCVLDFAGGPSRR